MEYKMVKHVDYDDHIGDVMSLWEFLDYYWKRDIVPGDGCIGEIIIDGSITDLYIPDWMTDWGGNHNTTSLKELCDFSFANERNTVEIRWCNK